MSEQLSAFGSRPSTDTPQRAGVVERVEPLAESREPGAESRERFSLLAEGLIGSPILKIAAEVRALIAGGHKICNLTVGDFAPSEFPVPEMLSRELAAAV